MDQDGVAVRLGPRDRPDADGAARAGPVLDHERLAELLRQPLRHVRAMMSVALPAVNGTITVTRLVGQDCDCDCASASPCAMHAAIATTHIQDRLITPP